ncbi:hypothetical protein [Funiculus sociatus]|uniref:hypothetical protein n=1 Tax=Funiculus sociatus TaxID=450527 RepID=UPI0019BDBBF7|nr:hypothetical protein [Trichocoleus sp. FACHB-69]
MTLVMNARSLMTVGALRQKIYRSKQEIQAAMRCFASLPLTPLLTHTSDAAHLDRR